MTEEITLDQQATAELRKFIANSDEVGKQAKDVGLRLKVVGGGCAGFQYALSLDEKQNSDFVFHQDELFVLVDDVSINFVAGSKIVYHDDINNKGFEVINPRAESACGCGSSFAMKE